MQLHDSYSSLSNRRTGPGHQAALAASAETAGGSNRELVDNGLHVSRGTKKQTTGEALLELVALGKKYNISGPADLSTNHDDYLYGDKE